MKWHKQQEQIFLLRERSWSIHQARFKSEIWGRRRDSQLLTASQKNILKVLSRNVVETQEFLLL